MPVVATVALSEKFSLTYWALRDEAHLLFHKSCACRNHEHIKFDLEFQKISGLPS